MLRTCVMFFVSYGLVGMLHGSYACVNLGRRASQEITAGVSNLVMPLEGVILGNAQHQVLYGTPGRKDLLRKPRWGGAR